MQLYKHTLRGSAEYLSCPSGCPRSTAPNAGGETGTPPSTSTPPSSATEEALQAQRGGVGGDEILLSLDKNLHSYAREDA